MSQDESNNGRVRPMGRGAQLLAALQNARRPDAGPVPNPVPPPIVVPAAAAAAAAASLENLPTVPRGRAAVLQMLSRGRQITPGAESPELPTPSQASTITEPNSATVSPVPSVPSSTSSLGRGMLARLRTLGLKPEGAVSPSSSAEPLRPPSGFMEERVTSPLVQQEKPPVVKMGESGTKVPITANYVRMNMEPDKGIFEYEVRFDPPVDSKDMRFKLLKQHQEAIGTAKTFDGVTLYLPFRFPQTITYFKSTQPVTNEEIMVKVILRQKRRPSECVHFYNVLIRRIARILGMVQMKRNYFNPSSPIVLPAEKLQLWPGLTTAVTEFEGGIMLCCDVSFRVLRTTTVLDELVAMSKNPSVFQKTAMETLVGLSVLTRYNNKMYRIDEILFDKNPMSTFDYQGNPITFVDYYKNHYDIEIKDKGQPLLLNRAKKKVHGKEDETQLICLIPELSYLTGLDDRLRSNFTIMRTLATHTRVPPMERQRALENYVNLVNTNEKASRVLSEWGLTLESNCLRIEGRQMEPEQLILSKSKFFPNAKFDWASNLMNDVLVPVSVQTWILVCSDRDHQKTQDFSKCLIEVSNRMGIRFGTPKLICLPNDRTDTYVNRIRDEINPQLQLVVCVFPAMRADRYSAVKTLCTAQYAVPSQCINSKTISQPQKLRSVVQKIALQINCKNGGELWAVNIPTKTMMVCGIDVYHDPGRRGPSVVGFVASTNATMTRWYSRAKFQEQGVEMVDTIKICLIESLKKYYETNHDYPKQIVMFRDGVGDGQLPFCAEHEVPQFLSAFQSVVPPFEPKFTMVVVQKRINARFFRVTPSGPVNPSPGTVIDHTVTRRDWWDYFLVSQHVNQGTVTPTHFVVVHDGGMKPDNLQKLTYKMTMLYYNWCGPVRVPAPCQYAHKLAYLVGENIRKDVKEPLCDRLFFL